MKNYFIVNNEVDQNYEIHRRHGDDSELICTVYSVEYIGLIIKSFTDSEDIEDQTGLFIK